MTKLLTLALGLLLLSSTAMAGLGIDVGAFSPNKALNDNDNALMLGLDYTAKFGAIGFKVEGFWVDSEGKYAHEFDTDLFAEATVDIEAILAADILFYPLATTFYLQTGVNYTSLDSSELQHLSSDVIDNQLGIDLGLGLTVFDKLSLQAKIMYTPDAITDDAAELLDIDENLEGFMVTAGWRF